MPVTNNVRARLRRVLERLYSGTGFRGPVITLLSGAGLALGLTYGAQLVLTRLYPPDAFGISDYFVSLVTVLLSLASLRYEDAVMIPESDKEAARVLQLAMLLALIFSGLLALGMLWPHEIASALGVPELGPWLWLLPLTVLLVKGSRLLETWLSRKKNFRPIPGAQVSASGAMAAFRIGSGVSATSAAGPGGLIGGFVIGQLASVAVLVPNVFRRRASPASGTDRNEPPSLAETARRYKRFALYSMPAAVLNAAFTRLPIILLPLFFGFTVVGYYGRAVIALSVPLSLVGTAIAQVFFVHAGEARRSGDLPHLTAQVHARLVMLGLLPTAAVMVAGPDLFEVVFGSPWRESGTYMLYVAPWMFLASVASPLTRLFDVLERQGADLATSIGMFIIQTGAIVIGGLTGDLVLTLLLLGASGFIARAIHVAVMLFLSRVRPLDALRPYARYGFQGMIPLLIIGAAAAWAPPWITLIATGAGLGGYYLSIGMREGILVARRPPTSGDGDAPPAVPSDANPIE